MRAPLRRCYLAALTLALVSFVASCSKDSSTAPVQSARPSNPVALIKSAGDDQTGSSGEAVPIRPAVKVVDAANQPLRDIRVTFVVTAGGGTIAGATPVTGTDGVATVDRWTLGDAGANTLSATVAGLPAQVFTATAQAAAFRPMANMALDGGVHAWSTIEIPKGVTVTVSKDVTITTTGDATIAGSLQGDCVSVSVVAGGKFRLAGTVNNSCTGGIPDAGAPGLRLAGMGGYVVDHGRAMTSGSFRLTNDTALKVAALGAASVRRANASMVKASTARDDTGIPCQFVGGTLTATPARMPNGANGTTGKPGVPGDPWSAECRGDMAVTGDLSITGQGGGDGGAGIDHTSGDANAKGGAGADGGLLTVYASGNLRFDSTTVLTSGRGGDGGEADASAQKQGGSATAVAGAGASPGLVRVQADGNIVITAPLQLNIGQAGDGGVALAEAEDGRDGAEACDPQKGGVAKATGGAGGSTPRSTLVGSNVTGFARVTVTGAAAGRGGDARGIAGNGGAGDQDCPDGADGGASVVKGGKGGDANLKDQAGNFVAPGGRGGAITFEEGNGGIGFDGCSLDDPEDGGDGGDAGALGGEIGVGGMGMGGQAPNGAVNYSHTGNGGDGGDGKDPGVGGKKALRPFPGVILRNPSFADGKDGDPCPDDPSDDEGDEFIVDIQEDRSVKNDTSLIRIFALPPKAEIRIMEQSGSAPKITVDGLSIARIPVVLQLIGPEAFDDKGNFRARTIVAVPMGSKGLQPVVVTIIGCVMPNGKITFILYVQPGANATSPFGLIRYIGNGARKA